MEFTGLILGAGIRQTFIIEIGIERFSSEQLSVIVESICTKYWSNAYVKPIEEKPTVPLHGLNCLPWT